MFGALTDSYLPRNIREHVGNINCTMNHVLSQKYGGCIQAINLPQEMRGIMSYILNSPFSFHRLSEQTRFQCMNHNQLLSSSQGRGWHVGLGIQVHIPRPIEIHTRNNPLSDLLCHTYIVFKTYHRICNYINYWYRYHPHFSSHSHPHIIHPPPHPHSNPIPPHSSLTLIPADLSAQSQVLFLCGISASSASSAGFLQDSKAHEASTCHIRVKLSFLDNHVHKSFSKWLRSGSGGVGAKLFFRELLAYHVD